MCRNAYQDHHPESPVYHGLDRVQTGVSGLDSQLPEGLPRNAFVLVTNSPGARWEALSAELVWRTLGRNEPVIIVTFQESPVSIVQQLLTFEWNVIPYLEDDQIHIIDCFTYRVSSYDRVVSRFTDWNTYLYDVTDGATTRLSDLDTMEAVHSQIDNVAERLGMRGEGVVLIDSLYELGTLTQPVHAHNFVKDVRADLSKGRFVPVFGGASTTVDESQFPHNMTYLVDGLVELTLWQNASLPGFQKHVRVPQVQGVTTHPQWIQFEYESGRGMVVLDPITQNTP
jgi:KaiC/GvpD/RAD55 family RecA-like ATPase